MTNWSIHVSVGLQTVFMTISAVLLCLVIPIIGLAIWKHTKNYNVPHIQKKIIFILSACVWFQLCFLLSIIFYKAFDFIEMALEIYLCIALWVFYNGLLKLLIAEEIKRDHLQPQELKKLAAENPQVAEELHHEVDVSIRSVKEKCNIIALKLLGEMHHLPGVNRILKPIQLQTWEQAAAYLRKINAVVFAYMIVLPLLLLLTIILESLPNEEIKHSFWIINLIKFLATAVAMYNILVFAHGMEHHIPKHYPTRKFLSLKLVVVLLAFQNFIIKLGNPVSDEQNTVEMTAIINNFLLSIENFIFAFVYYKYYSAEPFKSVNWAMKEEVQNIKIVEAELAKRGIENAEEPKKDVDISFVDVQIQSDVLHPKTTEDVAESDLTVKTERSASEV